MNADHTKTDEENGAHIVTDVPEHAVEKALESLAENREWRETNAHDTELSPALWEEHENELEEHILSHITEVHEMTVGGVPLERYLSSLD